MSDGTTELRKALDFMRIWISNDAHLGENKFSFSYELEKAEGLRKLGAIEQAIAAMPGSEREQQLEGVLRDWIACDPRCTNRSCGDCEHDEDDGCGLYRRMCELGVMSR